MVTLMSPPPREESVDIARRDDAVEARLHADLTEGLALCIYVYICRRRGRG